jgi:hypothetical protein
MQINVRRLMTFMTASMAVFLCLNSNSRAEVFDPTYSQPMEEQKICDLEPARQPAQQAATNWIQQKDDSGTDTTWFGDYTTSFRDRTDGSKCGVTWQVDYKKYVRYDNNGETLVQETDQIYDGTINGIKTYEQQCDINGQFSFQSGDRCYDPEDLAERDSCPDDGAMPSLPDTLNYGQNVCSVQPDGSRCAYSKSSNGDSFQYNPNLSCYENNYQEYEQPEATPPQDNQCQTITSGNVTSTFCPANPDAVCPNGLCQPACGSFDIGYGTQFGCFANEENQCDTNGDGIVDDACLTPPPSCEENPNQPHCPTSPEPVNCAENPEHEYCQNPPPNCEENPSQEGCGTTEPPTTEPPTDTIQGLEQIRGEQQKTNELLSGVKSGIEGVKTEVKGVKTSVDKLTEEQEKTTEATKEVSGAIVGLKNTLNNTGGVSMGITPSDGLNGWYDSEYPEGFTSVMETVSPLYDASKMNQYLQSWKVSVSGEYSFPQICLDIGIANYGCHSLEIDNRVFPFIRIIMIVSALFLARQLVFGG